MASADILRTIGRGNSQFCADVFYGRPLEAIFDGHLVVTACLVCSSSNSG